MAGLFVFWDWGHIRCCGCCRWRFRSYSDSLFQTPKSKQKALPRRTARSLGLGVPSLRDRSWRSGSGWLRCTYTRCVRLRHTVAALPRPDRSRNEACRRGKRSKARAKAEAEAKARSKAPHPSPLPEGEGTKPGCTCEVRRPEIPSRMQICRNQKPLTLALSRRERGLTEVFGQGTPTCDTASNTAFEKPKNRLPLPRERAGVRGESNTRLKPSARFSPLNNER